MCLHHIQFNSSKWLIYWNTDRKLSTFTVDSCSINDVFIDRMLDKIASYCFVLNEDLFHMRCCPHILNLMVKDWMQHNLYFGRKDQGKRLFGSVLTPKMEENLKMFVNYRTWFRKRSLHKIVKQDIIYLFNVSYCIVLWRSF